MKSGQSGAVEGGGQRIVRERKKPFDARLSFELHFSQWRAAVSLCGSFDFLENVQLGHRSSLLWLYAPFQEGK